MKSLLFVFIPVLVLLSASAHASILGANELSIDFTDAKEAKTKATWSDNVESTPAGLGWDGSAPSSRDGWIQTKPMATGLWWRPAQSVTLRVVLLPEPAPIPLANQQVFTPMAGQIFARYSADAKHWSSWQALRYPTPNGKDAEQAFTGVLGVPQRDRQEYIKRMEAYAKLDVPWTSDEDALARWIVQDDPDFFAHSIPFIGYVEFLVETSFHGGRRITAFKALVGYGIGGMHAIPKDPAAAYAGDQGNMTWRFTAP